MDRKHQEIVNQMASLLEATFPGADQAGRRAAFLEAVQSTLSNAIETKDAAVGAIQAKRSASEPIHVSLLGRCSARTTDALVDEGLWKTQKAMLLFAYLVSRGGRPVPDSQLTGTFWADSDEEHARSSLRNALHQLRIALASVTGDRDCVERNRRSRTVRFTLPLLLDIEEFENGVREAIELLAREEAEAALDRLQAVMPLYRGEFLEGFMDEWVLNLRAHYADLHLKGLHVLARCHLEMGDARSAEQVARYAVTLDNLREDLHADLLEALTAQDRRGEALRHYREMVTLFEEEMGVVPSTLHDIYDELLAEGPARMESMLQTRIPSPARATMRPAASRQAVPFGRSHLALVAS